MSTITAIAPNGSIRWTYTEPSVGQGVIAGPTVGPDGNIYAISDYGGLGAFALSPEGQLLWSNLGNPTFAENAQLGVEIVFGSGRLYAAFDERAVGPSTMFGLSLGRHAAVGERRSAAATTHSCSSSVSRRPARTAAST